MRCVLVLRPYNAVTPQELPCMPWQSSQPVVCWQLPWLHAGGTWLGGAGLQANQAGLWLWRVGLHNLSNNPCVAHAVTLGALPANKREDPPNNTHRNTGVTWFHGCQAPSSRLASNRNHSRLNVLVTIDRDAVRLQSDTGRATHLLTHTQCDPLRSAAAP